MPSVGALIADVTAFSRATTFVTETTAETGEQMLSPPPYP